MPFDSFVRMLRVHFPLHKARLHCLARFLVALFSANTVNLVRIAHVFASRATPDSCHRRLRRFLDQVPLSQESIARFVVRLFFPPQARLRLTLDRTTWHFGKHCFNILVLAVAHRGIALPLFWLFLGKKGGSNTAQRIELMKRFVCCFGRHRIECLLADREFYGRDWFAWLHGQCIRFTVRLKETLLVANTRGFSVDIAGMFEDLKPGQGRMSRRKRRLFATGGVRVYVVGCRTLTGALCVVASSFAPQTALQRYQWRWMIETLFHALKSRGFWLEETHLTKPERVGRLLGVLTLAVACAQATGMWRDSQAPTRRKRHGRLQHSVFRRGLDWIQDCLRQALGGTLDLTPFLRLFVPNPHPGLLTVPLGHGNPFRIWR